QGLPESSGGRSILHHPRLARRGHLPAATIRVPLRIVLSPLSPRGRGVGGEGGERPPHRRPLSPEGRREQEQVQMRRDFLKMCGLAGLGLAVPFRLSESRAAEKKDEAYAGPYYVVFNASGGWDTTYLMDPKGINEINRLYKEGDILTQGA